MQGNQDQELQGVEQISISLQSKHCSIARHFAPGLKKSLIIIYILLRISQH